MAPRRAVAVAVVLLVQLGCAGVHEVDLALPVRPKLALTGHERLYIGPFLRESTADEAGPDTSVDVAGEFDRYLRRLLRKEAKFVLVADLPDVRPPTTDPLQLARETDFWRQLGLRTGADFIVGGAINFQIQDRSGYETEEYVSPLDGRTYFRQKLVERTGFSYDILLQVYDGRTGQVVFEKPLRDFQETPQRTRDEFTGMFANLYALENQLIGVFVPRTVKSKRLLFRP